MPDGKGEEKIVISMEPPKPINTSLYKCDNSFHVEEVKILFENDLPFGFIIIDGHGTLMASLCGNNKEILNKFSVDLPKKHGRGG